MEIFNREINPRDGDDDEEESGSAGERKPEKQSRSNQEGQYHPLELAQPGLNDLWKRREEEARSVFGELMKRQAEENKDDEEEEDEEDDKKDKTSEEPETSNETGAEPVLSKESYAEAEEEKPEDATQRHVVESEEPEPKRPPETSVPPAHERLAEPGHEPDWLKEDRAKFSQAMEYEYGEEKPFAEAALSESNDKAGEPPAAELVTNPNVSLEPEPTHSVEGFHSEGAGHQYEGYVPGPARPAESTPQSFGDQAEQFTQEYSASRVNRGNMPAPQDVVRPIAREGAAKLKSKIERLGLRQKEAITWLALLGAAGYLASRLQRKDVRQQDKELKQAKREYQEGVQSLAASQQAMQDRFTGLQEQARNVPTEVRSGAPEPARNDAEQARAHVTPQMPENKPAPAASANELAARAREYQHPPPSETFQRERSGSALPPSTEITAAQPASKEQQGSEVDADAARRAIEEAAREQERPEDHKRVEQDAWLRHVIDDRTGREVEGAVRHGHEYEEERSRETFAGRPAFDRAKHSGTGAPVFVGGASQQGRPQAHPADDGNHALDSGQAQYDHSLPAGMQAPADLNHRLPGKERNPVVEALTSPWLFLLLSLVLLAYFIATLF